MIPVILAVAILIFTIMTFVPGNPASLILGADATEEQISLKNMSWGAGSAICGPSWKFPKNRQLLTLILDVPTGQIHLLQKN